MIVCDYGKAERPDHSLPLLCRGVDRPGISRRRADDVLGHGRAGRRSCVEDIALRYDGEKRNPWDEAECGHHYARAMSSWSTFVALSGFSMTAPKPQSSPLRQSPSRTFQCFWATATGWGTFLLTGKQPGQQVLHQSARRNARLPLLRIAALGCGWPMWNARSSPIWNHVRAPRRPHHRYLQRNAPPGANDAIDIEVRA